MRNYFDEQLELLNVELIRMGSLCEDGRFPYPDGRRGLCQTGQ